MQLPDKIIGDTIIQRGQILLSNIFESIDHEKFFLVIGVSEDEVTGFFYINSNINPLVNRKPEQVAMQYKILAKEYSFLSHDSYICATNVSRIPKAELVESIQCGRTRIIDTLKQAHLDELLQRVRRSRLFSAFIKRTFFY